MGMEEMIWEEMGKGVGDLNKYCAKTKRQSKRKLLSNMYIWSQLTQISANVFGNIGWSLR